MLGKQIYNFDWLQFAIEAENMREFFFCAAAVINKWIERIHAHFTHNSLSSINIEFNNVSI